jgi:mannose-6-phosphate isomerase-like protein (cupin superfamily)
MPSPDVTSALPSPAAAFVAYGAGTRVEAPVSCGIVRRLSEGEPVTAREDRSVVITVDLEELCATASWYGGAQPGASPHIHRRHADSFFVVDGELVFTIGRERVPAPAGTTTCVPPGVVHGFDSSSEARFLNFHTPDRGFAESLRLRRDGKSYDSADHDSFDPPPDGGAPTSDVVVLGSCEGDRLVNDLRQALVKVGRDELALVEFTLEPGFAGPTPHVHKRHVDSFFVLEGDVRFRIGDETMMLGPGGCVAAPPGVVHSFGHPGPEGARLINIHAPSCGFHEYLHVMEEADGDLGAATNANYDLYEVE